MKVDAPVEAEIAVVECFCDHCGSKLDKLKKIWIWNEHFGCTRDHAQRAQAETNRLFKQSQPESDADLL